MSQPSRDRIGTFELLGSLGAGAMGEVRLARDLTLDRTVALKFLPLEVTRDADRVARFRQEARAASALNHPNVCTIYALSETAEGQHYIAMEHIDGQTLRQRLSGPLLPLRNVLEIGIQLASALAAAHAAGVVHRDLKPENVMLRPDGLVKIVDFGLAKLAPMAPTSADRTLSVVNTQQGLLLGTIAYMSPEQARGHDVDARSDVWSLGVMLYELITGSHPFAGESVSDTLAAILTREPSQPARFQPEVPDDLQRIVSKMLRKDRDHRYQRMNDLLLDLETLAASSAVRSAVGTDEPCRPVPGQASSRSGVGPVPSGFTLRNLSVGLAVLVLVLIVGLRWWRMARSTMVAPDPASVVVLPFKTIGSGDNYFADGITEAVTTELGRVSGLKVIASNTAFGYRDNARFRDIGRRLGVALIVRGSVQRVAGNVRIDANLIDTRDDAVLWSDHYERPDDVLRAQDAIAQQIAKTVSQKFGRLSKVSLPSRATGSTEAFDAYLRGIWHLKNRSRGAEEGLRNESRRQTAIAELERAVADDPNFALAHAALARAYTQRFFYDSSDDQTEQKAFFAIERAVKLDPDLGEAYLARAQLTWTLRKGFQHEKAIADLRLALTLNPNLAEAYTELGKVYYHIGLTDLAVDANNQAERLDPSDATPGNRRLRTLLDAARLDEVRRDLERSTKPDLFPHAEALVAMGRLAEALTLLVQSHTKSPDLEVDTGVTALLALVYARLKRPEDAKRVLAESIPVADNRAGLSHMHHAQYYVGATLAQLGDHAGAMGWLQRAADEGYPSYPRFSLDKSLSPLRGVPAFDSFLTRLREQHDRWKSMP